MKADPTHTHPAQSVETACRYRNQATGTAATCRLSEIQGARRSQLVIDCAPTAQRAAADRSYPEPVGESSDCRLPLW